jgi:catechol 2,3-dioxygenase-like lactoylglutathione lyase family enzyme
MMIVHGFDHFTIRTEKLEETKAFFSKLLNLKEGRRPSFSFKGYWLYLDKQPIFHLAESVVDETSEVVKYLGVRSTVTSGSGSLDHLAFRIEGYADLLKKAEEEKWDFFERTVPDIKEHQLFFKDPNGITIEMIFHDEEYEVWKKEQSITD